jgi:hypothetical protein
MTRRFGCRGLHALSISRQRRFLRATERGTSVSLCGLSVLDSSLVPDRNGLIRGSGAMHPACNGTFPGTRRLVRDNVCAVAVCSSDRVDRLDPGSIGTLRDGNARGLAGNVCIPNVAHFLPRIDNERATANRRLVRRWQTATFPKPERQRASWNENYLVNTASLNPELWLKAGDLKWSFADYRLNGPFRRI